MAGPVLRLRKLKVGRQTIVNGPPPELRQNRSGTAQRLGAQVGILPLQMRVVGSQVRYPRLKIGPFRFKRISSREQILYR
ncbi:MAG: hypothetical protein N2383_13850 [Caldilineales bacterium]|nr:hypothetical protein [Caldilineales bacterium]